ncbi:MAG: helix-turn-helix domain-containing protein [Oscillibacter sp.]|nr:helix-turn-helix domain-containing protein [Oscillibacter sp.]
MDCKKIGELILRLRREKELTQQLADALHVSNKTVSKWECGRGCPDVSLWEPLSSLLGADLRELMQGELRPNCPDVGKLDRTRFYVCPVCSNLLTSTSHASVSCCGRQLPPLVPAEPPEPLTVSEAEVEDELYITVEHPMEKEHYLLFAAWVKDDRVWLSRLYPEQSPAFRMPQMGGGGSLCLYCVRHGLVKYEMNTLRRSRR